MRQLKILRGRALRTSLGAAILAGAGATALALAHPAGVQAALGAMSSGHSVQPAKAKSCNSGLNTGCLAGTNSGEGAGVYGNNTGNGPGVQGNASGEGDAGVFGVSSKSFGVEGSGAFGGVSGFCTGSSCSGQPGVSGDSESGPGVDGFSTSGAGVVASSDSADGVDGTAEGSGNGVFGTSNGGSQAGYGVEGNSSGKDAGVGGFNSNSTVNLAAGVYGFSSEGYGVYGQTGSGSSYGLYSEGNAFVDGEIFTSGSCKDGCSKTRHVAAFASRTSQPTIEDVGEAVLRDGAARVALAADFANTIDLSKPYVVTLTPEGDAGLYVASRTGSGFEVRQLGGGRSSIAFAYRIVAKPYGFKDERLPFQSVPSGPAFKQHRIVHPPAVPH
jgi:hypothetical protein